MPKSQRSYVSRHVYKTPTGMYYDDRTHKRITDRRGKATEKRAPIERERIAWRVRDEKGRLSLKKIVVNSDYRKKGTKHKSSPDNDNFETETAWEPSANKELALENARQRMDRELPDEDHWNVELVGEE